MYGAVALPATTGWGACLPGAYLARLSQEHGVIRADESLVNRLKVGDIVMILPVHSCLTANLMKKYQTLAGDLIPLGE
jgi:D-serine deaminase-like pyridoxal phosphate-dependent protein